MSKTRPSDEILNAFVDGEFSPEDRLLTLKSIAANDSMSREVCDMYQLKELVNMAYRADVIPPPGNGPVRGNGSPRGWWTAAAATVAVVALGTAAVLEVVRVQQPDPQKAAHAPAAGDPAAATTASARNPRQVLLHVTDVGPGEADALMDDVEFMFETAWLNGQQLEVQMVVHGNAMDLVRADLSPVPNRIRDLVHTYEGLRVTACGQSRARNERAEGRLIELLPWVEEVESGVREAAQRQAEGWTYIRV
jgi:uncharacterized protein